MSKGPVPLLFLKTPLRPDIGGNAKLRMLAKSGSRKTKQAKKYGNPADQKNKLVCNVTELIAGINNKAIPVMPGWLC